MADEYELYGIIRAEIRNGSFRLDEARANTDREYQKAYSRAQYDVQGLGGLANPVSQPPLNLVAHAWQNHHLIQILKANVAERPYHPTASDPRDNLRIRMRIASVQQQELELLSVPRDWTLSDMQQYKSYQAEWRYFNSLIG